MANSEQAKAPWGFMDPWWQILDAHNVFPHFACGVKGVVGGPDEETFDGISVCLDFPPWLRESRHFIDQSLVVQQCEALRDALELVFLSAVVDRRVFVQGLESRLDDFWKTYLRERLPSEVDEFPCQVVVTRFGERMSTPTAISTLLTPVKPHQRSQAFQDTRDQLLAAATASVMSKRLQITIGFGDRMLASTVAELASYIRTAPPSPVDYPFGTVLLYTDGLISDSPHGLAHISSCLGDPHQRVGLGSLTIHRLGATVQELGNVFSALFIKADERRALPADPSGELAGVQLKKTQMCSALMYAGFTELFIDWTVVSHCSELSRTRQMQWIMTALFSRKARHSIQEVRLQKFIVDDADMDGLESLLRSDNPLRILRGDLRRVDESSQSPGEVFLVGGILMKLTAPLAISSGRQIVELRRGCWADVVVEDAGDPELYEVHVPGYGLCKVRRSDALSHRRSDQDEDVGDGERHRIKSLALSCWWPGSDDIDYRVLCRFLRLIGTPLESLAVSPVEDFSRCLETVWAACPLLVRLEVGYATSDILRCISDAYESGDCRVHTLLVRHVKRQHGSQDIVRFCEQLCDPERAISRTVIRLTLSIDGYELDETTNDELVAMTKILECNQRLEYFSTNECYDERGEMLLRLLYDAHNNKAFAVPLALQAKSAFLQAVNASDDTESGLGRIRAIRALGTDVITRIFEMAARPFTRRVKVTHNYYHL